MAIRKCEHRLGGPSCTAPAVFRVSRGREYDAQDSCRRHLAATAETLAIDGGDAETVSPVTVILIDPEAPRA